MTRNPTSSTRVPAQSMTASADLSNEIGTTPPTAWTLLEAALYRSEIVSGSEKMGSVHLCSQSQCNLPLYDVRVIHPAADRSAVYPDSAAVFSNDVGLELMFQGFNHSLQDYDFSTSAHQYREDVFESDDIAVHRSHNSGFGMETHLNE